MLELEWLDGEGSWKDNNMHRQGTYTWSDSRKYDGEYYMNKEHGYGIYYWADGRRY